MKQKFFMPVVLVLTGIVLMESCTKPGIAPDQLKPAPPVTGEGGSLFIPIPLIVTTLAGNGTRGVVEGPGSQAEFDVPNDVAVDAFGNVYVADDANRRIRKITPAGVVSTLAGAADGNGTLVDGPGDKARFGGPAGMAIDGDGNLYIADIATNRIRKVAPDGLTTTIAGSGSFPFKGGFADGSIPNARFDEPTGVAVDASGNVYVADFNNERIRKVSGFTVSTIAGDGVSGANDGTGSAARFSGPSGVAVDAAGNIYVADQLNDRIRKITPDRVVTTLAGSTKGFKDGAGTTAQFNSPNHLMVDASGNVYVADEGNNRIRKITPAGVVTTLAGNGIEGFKDGTSTTAEFNGPSGITMDASRNFYISDAGNVRIRKISTLLHTVQ